MSRDGCHPDCPQCIAERAAHPVPEGVLLTPEQVAALTVPASSTLPWTERTQRVLQYRIRAALATTPAPLPDAEHESWCWRRHTGNCVDGPSSSAMEPRTPAPLPDAEGLDVERLARAICFEAESIESVPLDFSECPDREEHVEYAQALAAEYAALQSDPK